MKRYFKPGDRVQLRSGGPVMEVIKYVEGKDFLLGTSTSNHKVLCVWYDKVEGRKEGVFHQNSLIKTKWPVRFLSNKAAFLSNAGNHC
ncbi:hypothetical protein GCM10009122_24090 [Fulvivirga kasyanovii]|uniref:DUF2158 domain-containing protein n=1 Tax=Fulvivirga kasyanovii TaxID=396812 RepID=A0ABW9RV29_9BACT|nr:DUF2158 domain-containing protein [Fulvivirga kasyanovii]MTI27109.1 DUF2158 domain-containing protein [Fulvivirga kasyanovii]